MALFADLKFPREDKSCGKTTSLCGPSISASLPDKSPLKRGYIKTIKIKAALVDICSNLWSKSKSHALINKILQKQIH